MKKRFGTDSWRARAEGLKSDSYALYLACRDPRVPLLPKLIGALAVAYALSPIDLIPDFVPVLGYLDDLILVPACLALAMRLIPPAIMAEHRARARKAAAPVGDQARGSVRRATGGCRR
jgi:uncharacterized membrane protein YkvA (DUF1232 family)